MSEWVTEQQGGTKTVALPYRQGPWYKYGLWCSCMDAAFSTSSSLSPLRSITIIFMFIFFVIWLLCTCDTGWILVLSELSLLVTPSHHWVHWPGLVMDERSKLWDILKCDMSVPSRLPTKFALSASLRFCWINAFFSQSKYELTGAV